MEGKEDEGKKAGSKKIAEKGKERNGRREEKNRKTYRLRKNISELAGTF